MIDVIVSKVARREFNRALKFEDGNIEHFPRAAAQGQCERLLYLHIPFCEQLCPYCSFHRVVFEEDLCRAYFAALRKEILLYKRAGWSFSGIYCGGGTPTVLLDELCKTIDLARAEFPITSVSVETNPNHLTEANAQKLLASGVGRLSVGVQSFDEKLLKQMQRYTKYGSGEEIASRLHLVNGLFDTVNVDMIFNFPTQSEATLIQDVKTLLDIGVSQITYYPLMVSDFARAAMLEKLGGTVDYRRERKFYKLISKHLEKTYSYSSAWCFSRNTAAAAAIDEYIVDFDEYAGLGSGAIGFLASACYANTFDIKEYIASVNTNKLPLLAVRCFTQAEQARYDFMMKLFSTRLVIKSLEKKHSRSLWRYIWKDLLAFRLAGAITIGADEIRLTPTGRYLWVALMREFFIAVNNFRDYCRK